MAAAAADAFGAPFPDVARQVMEAPGAGWSRGDGVRGLLSVLFVPREHGDLARDFAEVAGVCGEFGRRRLKRPERAATSGGAGHRPDDISAPAG